MANFKIGQKVICVDDSAIKYVPLIKDRIYIISNIYTCSCGDVKLAVGFFSHTGTICKCGTFTSPGDWWFFSSRFKPVDDTFATEILENIEKQIKEEKEKVLVPIKSDLGKMKASEVLTLMKHLEPDWKLKVNNPKNWGTYKRIIIHSAINN